MWGEKEPFLKKPMTPLISEVFRPEPMFKAGSDREMGSDFDFLMIFVSGRIIRTLKLVGIFSILFR